MLLQWGCDRADAEGVDIFVQTNMMVLSFYEKFGFEVNDTMEMPGGFGYREYFLVRRPRTKTTW